MKKTKKQKAQSLTKAQQALITTDLIGYAEAVAMRYAHCGVELDDVKSAARHGLCEAALHYDSDHENTFKTYATFYIKKYIIRAIEQWTNPMRVPGELRKEVYILSLDMPVMNAEDTAVNLLDDEEVTVSEMRTTLSELLKSDDDAEYSGNRSKELIALLSPIELEVLQLVFGSEGKTLTTRTAARRLNLVPKRFTRILNKAILTLKSALN